MKKKIFFLLFLFFLLFSLLSIFVDVDWSLFTRFSVVDMLGIGISLALETALYTFMIYLLIREFFYTPKIIDVYLVLTASLTANYATPFKMGVPLRVFLYREKLKIPGIDGTSIILIEIFLNVFVSLCLSFLGISFVITDTNISIGTFLFILLLLTIFFFLIKFDKIEKFIAERTFVFSSFLRKIFSFIHNVKQSLCSVSFKGLSQIIFLYFLTFGIQAVRLWLVLSILGIDMSIVRLLFVLTISTTLGTLSMIPMGIGVKDASFTFLLTHLGVPAEIAIVVAAIQRIFSPGWPLFLGVISVNILGISTLLRTEPA